MPVASLVALVVVGLLCYVGREVLWFWMIWGLRWYNCQCLQKVEHVSVSMEKVGTARDASLSLLHAMSFHSVQPVPMDPVQDASLLLLQAACPPERTEPQLAPPSGPSRSLPHQCAAQPDTPGGSEDNLVVGKLARCVFASLPAWAQQSCKSWISKIGSDGLRLASIYTGSDFARTTTSAFLKCARPVNFPMPKIRHVMSVEHIGWKQHWIRTMFPPEVLTSQITCINSCLEPARQ